MYIVNILYTKCLHPLMQGYRWVNWFGYQYYIIYLDKRQRFDSGQETVVRLKGIANCSQCVTHRMLRPYAPLTNQTYEVWYGCNKASPPRAILQVNPETAGRPYTFFSNVKQETGQVIPVLFYWCGVRQVISFTLILPIATSMRCIVKQAHPLSVPGF